MTLSIIDFQHNNVLHYADCRNAKCYVFFVDMLSVIMLGVVMLNVVILSALAPGK